MSTLLFSPHTIKDVTFKNRLVMAPMCMYSVEKEDGHATDFHHVHYGSRAAGQVGLIIIEATAVAPGGRISSKDLGIWDDAHVAELSKLVKIAQSYGSKVGIQLAHSGRKAEGSEHPVAPSPIPFDNKHRTPHELAVEEIKKLIQDFRLGAKRAKEAGFDVIEIHAAHGYLINSFLSPLTNKRTDAYGGSKEKRYTFLREVIEEVKREWTGPLFVRISAEEYVDGGYTTADYIEIVEWMQAQGVDVVDVSTGAVTPADIASYPSYQVPFAEKIKKETGVTTGAVGMITTGKQAEDILQQEKADLIFIGRELLRNPYFPRFAAKELGVKLSLPRQYDF